MTILRIFAIISILYIISTSSAPQGIEFGIKSKVYFGRDGKGGGMSLPKFEIKMPGVNLPLKFPLGTLGMKAPNSVGTIGSQKQQLPFQVSPQAMNMLLALMKPVFDNGGMAQQVVGPVLG